VGPWRRETCLGDQETSRVLPADADEDELDSLVHAWRPPLAAAGTDEDD